MEEKILEVFEFSPLIVAIVPLVVGLVEAIKKKLGVAGKYAPFIAIAFGIGLVALTGVGWQTAIIQGIIAGLAASGLYSGAKSTIKPKQ